jgi:uncharacterized protein involved in exopolysaccharide biosynthesis
MGNKRFHKGFDMLSGELPVPEGLRLRAKDAERLRSRWFYAACMCVFCFGLLSILIAFGDDRFAAKAAIFAVGKSLSLDVAPTSKLPDRVLRQVVEGEGLAADPEFVPQPWSWLSRVGMVFGVSDYARPRDQARDGAVLSLRQVVSLRRLQAEDGRQTSNDRAVAHEDLPWLALEIEVTSLDADKAARIANAVAQAIVDEQGRDAAAKEAHRQAVANEVSGFAARLQIAKQNLIDFRDAQDQRSSSDETGSIGEHGDPLIALVDAKADKDLIARAIATGRTSSLTSLHFSTPDLDRSLSQYAELEQRYQKSKLTLGEKHPDLIVLDGEVRAAQKDIHDQWLKIADIANRNYHAAQTRVAAGAHVASAMPNSKKDAGLERLQSDLDTAKRDYDRALLLQAKEEASAERQASLSVTPAKPPLSSTHKPHGIIIGAAMMLGAMFGAGRTLADQWRHPIEKSPAGKTSALQNRKSSSLLPIPRIKKDWLGETLRLKLPLDVACGEALERPGSAFSQAIENLIEKEIGLEFRETVKVLFISKEDGLGVTTIAVNAAQMAAKAGARVLVIEANRRRPVLASLISPQVNVDLIDLAGTKRIICQLRPGLSVIPLFSEETTLNLAERARHYIKGIGKHFDLVIIDGGTYAEDDTETQDLVDSVNRVFHLTPEGIELKTGRMSFRRRR